MNLYGHIALSSLACDTILFIPKARSYSVRRYKFFAAGFFFMLAAFLHIFIDSLPHIDFLYQIKITFLNKWWLKQGVFALAYLAILAFSQSKRFILVKLSAILGGIYPAMEKLLYFENILPERWVVFKSHSLHLSQQPGYYLCLVYIVFEISVAAGALAAAGIIKKKYGNSPG